MGRVVARSRRSLAESGRAAAALRDRDLVDLAATGSRDAARMVRWLRSRTELAAAQALVVG
ncbi:hypothetical protein [Actinomycetospora chiangmaiensis]|uniref:hypothetical protein n=1 Tax=Actinomycetospora chiangmaiensis TaxID=402650 RepID=UPI00037C5426|nr:hypothetical protein [Actinomycetospora chiangmaiensis]